MKMWAGLWVEVFRLLAANPLKEMVGTRRLELLTSTVSRVLVNTFITTYRAQGDCQVPATTCKAEQSWVGCMGGEAWKFMTEG